MNALPFPHLVDKTKLSSAVLFDVISNLSWCKEGNSIQYCLVRSEGHIDEVLSKVEPSATCYSTRPPRILG